MSLIGFVIRIHASGGYCFLKAGNGEEYFAHRRDFKDKSAMKLSQYVTFTEAVRIPGKAPAATNVEAYSAAKEQVA